VAEGSPLSSVSALSERSVSWLEYLTKLVLFGSLAGALITVSWGLLIGFGRLSIALAVAFSVAWSGARVRPRIVRTALFATCYLVPAAFIVVGLKLSSGRWVVWMAPLAGAVVATTPWRRWAMPPVIRLPLATSALIVATTWPIVVLREADFLWTRIHPSVAVWVATVAAATILGILWLDSLFASFSPSAGRIHDFEQHVVLPMAAGFVIAALVGVYQMFGDITFLNVGLFGAMNRASGTLGDANPFGVISAIWGPLLFATAVERGSHRHRAAGVAALPLSWVAVWASGSRSSLPIAALSLVIILHWYVRSAATGRNRRLATVAAALLIMAGLGAAGRFSRVESPIARIAVAFEPDWSLEWVSKASSKLRTRDGYGPVTSAIIRDFPAIGLGVGAFHLLVPTYAWKVFHGYLPPDNAQNWFRHQLAELGIIGSVGWAVWVAWFVWQLAFGRAANGRPLTTAVLRGVLLGFGLISLVGMPGLDVAVIFTFWSVGFWFLALVHPPGGGMLEPRMTRSAWWLAVWVLVLGYASATAYVARNDLSLPVRSAAADLGYTYGFYGPEPGGTLRWARRQAVDVLPVVDDRRWLSVTVSVNHLDVVKKPVAVKVWIDRQLLIDVQLSTIAPITRYYKVPDRNRRVVLETRVNRTLNPRDFGVPDDRELGLLVDAKFVDAPTRSTGP
jgi:hypothetical protein